MRKIVLVVDVSAVMSAYSVSQESYPDLLKDELVIRYISGITEAPSADAMPRIVELSLVADHKKIVAFFGGQSAIFNGHKTWLTHLEQMQRMCATEGCELSVQLIAEKKSERASLTSSSLLVNALPGFLGDSKNHYPYHYYEQPSTNGLDITSRMFSWDKEAGVSKPADLTDQKTTVSHVHIYNPGVPKDQVLQGIAKKFGAQQSQVVLVSGKPVVEAKGWVVKAGLSRMMNQTKLIIEGRLDGEPRIEFNYNTSNQSITMGTTTQAAAVWRQPDKKQTVSFNLNQNDAKSIVAQMNRHIGQQIPGAINCLPLLEYIVDRSQQGLTTHFGFWVFRQHKSKNIKISAAIAILNIILGIATEQTFTDLQIAAILERPSGLNTAFNQLGQAVRAEKFPKLLQAQTPVAATVAATV